MVDTSLQFVVETLEWRGFTGEKINQSILNLWATQISIGIQSITRDLLCYYALLNAGIQTLHSKV